MTHRSELIGKYLAALDLGTNSFHMIVAKVVNENSFEIVGRAREVIRIGRDKIISPGEINSAVQVLLKLKNTAISWNAEIKAVATSAVRESENSSDFVNRVARETGINVEIISGKEEAELIYRGIIKGLKFSNKKLFCTDIGGGSTEFITGDENRILLAESVKVGAVRLTNIFFPDDLITNDSIQKCKKYVEENIMPVLEKIRSEGFDSAAGASGTIQSVAGLINFRKNKNRNSILHGSTFSSEDLKNISELIFSKKTGAERKAIDGIEINRADILPAGLIILNKIFDKLNLKEIIISSFGLREGILFKLLQDFSNFHSLSH